MTDNEMIKAIKQVDGLGGMTVNERLLLQVSWTNLTKQKKATKQKREEFWSCLKLTNLPLTK